MKHERVLQAIDDIRNGKMVILVDDEDRENEGDLCMAADLVTSEDINFMATYGRGLICLALDDQIVNRLELPLMVSDNTSPYGTAFTVSIEAREGVSTGISAGDRATTIRCAVDPGAKASDLARPGHVFPLRARKGGVLVRTGQTEGSVDLARLAGRSPAGVICEIMNEDGTMARREDLDRFAQQHGVLVVTVAELIRYRLNHEPLVKRLVERTVEHHRWGTLRVLAYGTELDDRQHLAVVVGKPEGAESPLVRVQPGYGYSGILGDLLYRDQLGFEYAMDRISEDGHGVVVCLDREVPVMTLKERLESSPEQDGGASSDSPPSGGLLREIGIGAQVIRDLGIERLRVLTNHPQRIPAVEGFGLQVDSTLPFRAAS